MCLERYPTKKLLAQADRFIPTLCVQYYTLQYYSTTIRVVALLATLATY
jgi:hypothetical protein